MELNQIHGAFYGSTLTYAECEVLTIAKIPAKITALEANLYGCKWFDYRELHPAMATYLLAHHFNRAYGEFMGQTFDHSKRFMASFKGKDVMNAREVKSFWKLRQKIDELGIRYDFFCRHAMQWCGDNGWKQPPRPAHVTTNPDMIIHVMNKWHEESLAKIQWASSPRFLAENWYGADDQVAYEKYLIEKIMQKPHPKFSLHAALYLHGTLRIETAIQYLSESALRAALDMCLANVFSHR